MTARLDGARVQAHDGFLLVELSGDPYERGRQHGELLAPQVRLFRDRLYRDIVFKKGRGLGAAFTAVLYGLLSRMHRHIPREMRQEMRGVADGAGISYRDVLLFNCFDDLLHGLILLNPVLTPIINHRFLAPILGRLACSSFVLCGTRTESGSPLHGRNLDYLLSDGFVDPEGIVPRLLREHLILFVVRPRQGRPFASVAWPGFIGAVTALNRDGLSLACLTSTVPRETPNGIPLPLLYRLMAQYAGTVDEAEWMVRGARRTIGNNLTVSAADGDAKLFEFTPDRLAVRQPRDGVLRATNHFQDAWMAERQVGWVIPNSNLRLSRLGDLFGDGRASDEQFSLAQAQEALIDTCSSGGESEWDTIRNPGTIYSTVADPSRLILWVRNDAGADRPFVRVDLAQLLGAHSVATAA